MTFCGEHQTRGRKARSRIWRATAGVIQFPGARFYNDGGEGGGSGGGNGGSGGGSGTEKPDESSAKKLELTEEELAARIEAEVKKRQEAADKKRREEEEAAELERKKQEGDLKGLLEAEQKARQEKEGESARLALELKQERVKARLSRYLVEKHSAYVTSADWIFPGLKFDANTSDTEIDKQIEAEVKRFVEANPRQTKAPPPAAGNRGKAPTGEGGGDEKKPVPPGRYMSRL